MKKHQIVAIDFTNKPEYIWIWYGLWSLGAKPAFINYNLTGRPLVHSLQKSSAKLVLVDEEIQDNFTDDVRTRLGDSVQIRVFTPATETSISTLAPHREDDSARKGQHATDMAVLIYTSGTTGFPKPAIVPWAKVNGAGAFVSGFLSLTPTDVFHTSMPLYHSAGSILCCVTAIAAGATISLSHRFSPRSFWADVRAHNATVIQYVGETLRYLLAVPPSPRDTDHKVRLAFGNGLRPDVWNRVKTRFNIDTIVEFYAATEGNAGVWNISRNDFSAGAIGRSGMLMSNMFKGRTEIIALDPISEQPIRHPRTGLCQRVASNQAGELLGRLDAHNIKEGFLGYYNDETASDKKILRDVLTKGDAWFRTGDLIRRDDAHGLVYFVDRLGDTFRWKSENVATSEVAQVLGAHPAITEANVYGVLAPSHDGRAGCATVVLREGQTPDAALLRALAHTAQTHLAPYAVPIFLRITPTLATTGTQKTLKHALREEGVDPAVVRARGDRIFWLRDGTYVPFEAADWARLKGGAVKL